MPNHITSHVLIVRSDGEWMEDSEFETLHDFMIGPEVGDDEERRYFDFNKLLPMPKALVGTISPPRIVGEDVYEAEVKKAKKEYKENPRWGMSLPITEKMSAELIVKYGANNWYDWCNSNWGTKWNAYNSEQTDRGWKFDSAWGSPLPVIVALSKKFPKYTFKVAWVDEGGGSGFYVAKEGELVEDNTSFDDNTITIDSDLFEHILRG